MRAVVVGSGIAGLSCAIALRKVGIEAAVYERAPALGEVGAGISLWANALRALDRLGAGAAVRAAGLALTHSEMRASSGRKLLARFEAGPFEKSVGVSPFICMIHRAELVAALAGLLPPGVARYGHTFSTLRLEGKRVAVGFKDGHTDTADVLIGADGVRSAVRGQLFPGEREPRYAGYTCWRGVCPRPAAVTPGYVGEWWGRGRRFGITTLPGDRVYWFATLNAPPGGKAADERAAVAAAFREYADPVPELIASTPADKVIRNDIVDRPPARPWSKGRVGLVGDAAHPTTPNLGQGGCMAIEDAVVLARCLATAADPADGLAAFEDERYARTTAVTNESWRFGRMGQMEGRLACRLRDAALGPLMRRFGAKTLPKYAAFDVGELPAKG